MSVFQYLKALSADDAFAMDFLERSLENNKVCCLNDPQLFGGFTCCVQCCDKCKKMNYLFEIFWHYNKNIARTEKETFCCVFD